MALALPTSSDVEHFDAHGWCVVRGVLTEAEAAAGRAMMDELLTADSQCDHDGRPFQARPWPALSALENGGPTRSGDVATVAQVEHPIHDERTALGIVAAASAVAPLLRSKGAVSAVRGGGLKLIHQNWRRTLPTPPPEGGYLEYLEPRLLSAERAGLHMDTGFLPRHYDTTPRSSYVLSLLALSPVVSGGAPFLVGPGSYSAARAASRALPHAYQASVNAKGCYQQLRELMMAQVKADQGEAKEVTMEAGSLLVFDPMLSHQGSPFREGVTHAAGVGRYAQFQVWADEAAIGDSIAGVPQRAYSAPASKYTQAMHDALPEWARPMLDWEMPLYEEDEPGLSPLPPRGSNARL